MDKQEKIFCLVTLVIIAVLLIHGYWRHTEINKDPTYVIAKIYSIQDTENGNIYPFKYKYNSVEYDSNAKTDYVSIKDSTLILKISKSNPKLWTVVDELP